MSLYDILLNLIKVSKVKEKKTAGSGDKQFSLVYTEFILV